MTAEAAAEVLKAYRQKIDALDLRILALLNERAAVAVEIGEIKKSAALPVVELSREQAVIDGMVSRNGGPLAPVAVETIYTAIMLEMRRLQDQRR